MNDRLRTREEIEQQRRIARALEKIAYHLEAKEDRKDEKRKRDFDFGAPHSALFRGHYGL